MIDDCKMSLSNEVICVTTPVRLNTVDAYLSSCRKLMRLLRRAGYKGSFRHLQADHESAYRQLLALLDTLAHIIVIKDERTGGFRFFLARRLLFGQAGAVLWYNRV